MQISHFSFSLAASTAIFLVAVATAKGGTVEAKSPALGDVKLAIGSAREGDTVIIPPGEASWTSPLVITKGITLKGATSIDGPARTAVVDDKTVILDDVPRPNRVRPSPKQQQDLPQKHTAFGTRPSSRGQDYGAPRRIPGIVVVELKPNQSFRLTGLTFKYGSVTQRQDKALLCIKGTCPSVRVDHCHFDQLYDNPFVMTHGQIYGVVDHCVFDERPRVLTFQVYHDGWGGHTHGNGSWSDSAYFGSEKFLFIEDNTFRNANGYQSVGIDAYGGGRYVARHNYLVDTPVGGHGTESSGRFRGVRATEVYDNTCMWNLVDPRGQLRSGTMLEFNNVWTGKEDRRSKSTRLTCYRQFRPFPLWGGANGDNRLDSNDSHGLYASGKHTGGNGSATLVVANAGWKDNQWVGYSVTNTTQRLKSKIGAVFHPSSYVVANTIDTITFARDESFGGANITFNTGDSYEIYKLLAALDQPGRGKGDLLNDRDPVVTGSWPHQELEPVYAWGNTYNHLRQLDLASPFPTIQENRDFYNQKTPFDGTVGVGVGKLAERPKTCTLGVAYWATDQGEWDSTHDGPDGQLYVCSEPNTWTFYYKPYTYPHPLVSGTPASSEKTAQGQGQADTQSSSIK